MKFGKFFMVSLMCLGLILSACSMDDDEMISVGSEDETTNNNNDVIEVLDKESEDELFMKEVNLTLTGKEVQYNMQNNLDKKFFLKGRVELCNYYNYGFLNESKFFCGKMITEDSGTWYLYFNRERYNIVYNDLLNGNLPLMVSATIPTDTYKNNQGNMAVVMASKLYNPYEDN